MTKVAPAAASAAKWVTLLVAVAAIACGRTERNRAADGGMAGGDGGTSGGAGSRADGGIAGGGGASGDEVGADGEREDAGGIDAGPLSDGEDDYSPVTPDPGDEAAACSADGGVASLRGVFVATGKMIVKRQNNAAVLLGNGKVLFAGGRHGNDILATAELYDPASGRFRATGNMATARKWMAAALLPDGRVLVAGGTPDGAKALASAELYDPQTGTFAATGNMAAGKENVSATALPNGKVLIAGGYSLVGPTPALVSAELYDATTGTFTPTGNMNVPRYGQSATLLQNGKVLMVGGADTLTAEIYDPATGTFVATGTSTLGGPSHRATLLGSGKVLIAGGFSLQGESYSAEQRAELYDPTTGIFTETGRMTMKRSGASATLLNDGRVLVTGGNYELGAELYDPTTGSFTVAGETTGQRLYPRGIRLCSGRVLLVDDAGDFATVDLYE